MPGKGRRALAAISGNVGGRRDAETPTKALEHETGDVHDGEVDTKTVVSRQPKTFLDLPNEIIHRIAELALGGKFERVVPADSLENPVNGVLALCAASKVFRTILQPRIAIELAALQKDAILRLDTARCDKTALEKAMAGLKASGALRSARIEVYLAAVPSTDDYRDEQRQKCLEAWAKVSPVSSAIKRRARQSELLRLQEVKPTMKRWKAYDKVLADCMASLEPDERFEITIVPGPMVCPLGLYDLHPLVRPCFGQLIALREDETWRKSIKVKDVEGQEPLQFSPQPLY